MRPALRERALQMGIVSKVPTLLGIAQKAIATDLDAGSMVALGRLGLEMDRNRIKTLVVDESMALPFTGPNGEDLLQPNRQAIQAAILRAFSQASGQTARVEVLNGTDRIGVARLHTNAKPTLDAILERVQNDLFDLGADLATPHAPDLKFEPLRIQPSQVDRLEAEVDQLNEQLEPLTSFILPGGSPAAAHLHLARAIARRSTAADRAAERTITAIDRQGTSSSR